MIRIGIESRQQRALFNLVPRPIHHSCLLLMKRIGLLGMMGWTMNGIWTTYYETRLLNVDCVLNGDKDMGA